MSVKVSILSEYTWDSNPHCPKLPQCQLPHPVHKTYSRSSVYSYTLVRGHLLTFNENVSFIDELIYTV